MMLILGRRAIGARSITVFLVGLLWLASAVVPTVHAAEQRAKEPPLRVAVDPRVELVSIIFRLAGNPEYGRGQVGSYTRDADQHFAPFKDHAVVAIARKLRQTRRVGYDAPMALAVHLKDTERLETVVPLEPWPESLDSRWTPQAVRELLEAARQFVRFASEAVKNAAGSPSPDAISAAQAGAMQAARKFAPGLLNGLKTPQRAPAYGHTSGRWSRHGRNIIIVNC